MAQRFHKEHKDTQAQTGPKLIINVEINLDGNMMQMEENIQDALNEAVFAEVIHFASDSDEGPAGGFVPAVFGELFSRVHHLRLG